MDEPRRRWRLPKRSAAEWAMALLILGMALAMLATAIKDRW